MSLPKIASRDEWLAARKELLAKEKELTRQRDALNTERRDLPMVEIDEGLRVRRPRRHGPPDRPVRRAAAADHLPLHVRPGVGRRLPELHRRHQRAVAGLPRPPAHARHELRDGVAGAAREARAVEGEAGVGDIPWYSSFGTDFNYDFGVTIDESVGADEYNFRTKAEFEARGEDFFALRPAVRDARPQLLPAGRRTGVPHVLAVRPRPRVAPAARTTSSTSPRSAARRSGRSRRAAASRCAPTSPTSPPDHGGRQPARRPSEVGEALDHRDRGTRRRRPGPG